MSRFNLDGICSMRLSSDDGEKLGRLGAVYYFFL